MTFKYTFYILFFIFFASNSFQSFGQKSGVPTDTLMKNNKQIILFSNNRWFYMDDLMATSKADTFDVCSKNWEINDIFAYLNERGKINEYPAFDLLSLDPDNFTMPRYGKLYRGFEKHHTGLDIGLKLGDSVIAAFDGKVRFAQYNSQGYGNMVIIRHKNGLETWYAHLSKILVSSNQEVTSGQLIGLGGMTGRATSPHLHLEARYHDRPFDPLSFIDLEHHLLRDDIPYRSLLVNKNQSDSKKNNTTSNSALADTLKNNHPVPIITIAKSPKNKKEAPSRSSHTYKIQKGDTLFKIAKKNHITVHTLCEANHITADTKLNLGKKLIIP